MWYISTCSYRCSASCAYFRSTRKARFPKTNENETKHSLTTEINACERAHHVVSFGSDHWPRTWSFSLSLFFFDIILFVRCFRIFTSVDIKWMRILFWNQWWSEIHPKDTLNIWVWILYHFYYCYYNEICESQIICE